jgi:peptidyl-prolyl cis-trans isomerase C
MKSRHILATSVVIMLASTEVITAADKPAKPAAPPKVAPAKTAPAKPAPAAKDDAAKPAAKPAPAEAAPAAPAVEIKDPVAIVDGQEIKVAEVEAALAGFLAQQHKTAADVPPDQKPRIYRSIVDDMIVEKIIKKRSAEEKITDEDIAKVYDGFKKNVGGSEEELKKQIEANGETVEGVKKNIRTRLQAQHWVDGQLAGKIDVADTDAENFYKQNPEQFKMPERVRASHILIKVEPEAKPDDVVAKQKAAGVVLARVKKGEDFGKLADELSEDPSAKQNHGDLDFFQKEQMVPEFADAAFKMKKGDVSPEPVRSQFGYHIIKVTDRKDAETMQLDEVKPKLLAFLKNQKRETELMKLAKDLRSKADVKINLPELPKEPEGAQLAPGDEPPVK